jgi:hypothetical protein
MLLAAPLLAAPPPAPPRVSAKDREAIVADITAALDDTYVFPDTAKKMGDHLRRQLHGGAYDTLDDLVAFTQKLTEDLRSISHDLHLGVFWAAPDTAAGDERTGLTPEQRDQRFAARLRRDNACFHKVERLAGNVGYLKLDCFAPAQLGGATAVAAMSFLAGSDALIIDLRDNGGGSPSMVQLLASYLLPADHNTLLNSFYVRKENRTDQFWTAPWVPGPRLSDAPVYVLTSKHTFSAAEEFTYDLKNLKRATIVGETTGGGSHPQEEHRVAGYPVVMSLPFGRPVNPITGTNWEGTGVVPDLPATAAEALAVAHSRALAAIAEKATDAEMKAEAEFARVIVEGRRRPSALSAAEMEAYVGAYGPGVVTLADGALWYQRPPGPQLRLLPIGGDRFLVGDLDHVWIRFERADGRIVRLVVQQADGIEEPSARDGR